MVPTQGEEVVEVDGRVDGGGGILPEEGAVLWMQQQCPVEDVQEQHHLVAPWVLAGHAQEHFLQQLDPKHLVEGVQTEQLLTCRSEDQTFMFPLSFKESIQTLDDYLMICFTLRLVEKGKLCINGGSWEGGQTKEVFLQQGDVGLLVHSWNVLSEGDEEKNTSNLL